jgi:hypothetical protein
MAFIFLALTLLIIYKFVNDKKCPSAVKKIKEGFNDDFQKINSFIRNVDNIANDVAADHPDLTALRQEAETMNTSLDTIKSKLAALETEKLESKRSKIQYDRADLSGVGVVQALQNEQIDELENKIAIAKQMIKDREMEDVSKTYPKIPVYSSCIVANAGGDYSADNLEEDIKSGDSTNVDGGSYSTTGTWTERVGKTGVSDMSSSSGQGQQGPSNEDNILQFLEWVSKKGVVVSGSA